MTPGDGAEQDSPENDTKARTDYAGMIEQAHGADTLFEAATARVADVVASLHPNDNEPERADRIDGLEDALARLGGSPTLKLVRVTGEDGARETIETADSESPEGGINLAAFSQLFGVDEHAGDDELLEALARASGKPVSAILDGKIVEAVQPNS